MFSALPTRQSRGSPHCHSMLVKIVCSVLCLAVAAAQQATQWPAGVAPASCPNYPDCSLTPAGYANAVNQYPAGVWPAACPDYPNCPTAPAAPVGYVNTAGYPAGLSPASCPNFPYCY